MDKRIDYLGINPDIRLDQILIDANANRPAMFAMVEALRRSSGNFILSGCVVTVGGAAPTNTWSLTEGHIFLNGEILKVNSQSGIFDSGTEFLAFSKVTTYNPNGDIVYLNGTPRQTWQENRGVISVVSSVTSTQLDAINGYILRDLIYYKEDEISEDDIKNGIGVDVVTGRRLAAKDGNLITKIINIGAWDMDITASVSIAHGLTYSKIRFVEAMIQVNANPGLSNLCGTNEGGDLGGYAMADATNINLYRATGGRFDNTNYNGTSTDRGFIKIKYIP